MPYLQSTHPNLCRFISIFLCRFMLDLRSIYYSPDGPNDATTTSRQLSDLYFASRVVRSLGASLEMEEDHIANTDDEPDEDDVGETVEVSLNPFLVGLLTTIQRTSSNDTGLQSMSPNVS